MINTEFGKHCNYKYCKQRDFLPIQCGLCQGSYCTEHRTVSAHECSKQHAERKAIVCPLCQKSIQYISGQSEDQLWDKHYFSECTQEAKQKKRCQAQKCKLILTELNSTQCKECQQIICLKHRMPEDHNCQPVWKMSRQPIIQPIVEKKVIIENKPPAPDGLPEECPVCNKRFLTLMHLITHSNIHAQ